MAHAESRKTEVLVVGAGPSGLVLALGLARNGLSVRIVEKSLEQRIGQRGAGVMPRSMELFEMLGVAERILEVARLMPRVKTYDIGRGLHSTGNFEMAPYAEPNAAFPYMNILCLGQDHLEAMLRRELQEKYNVTVELGVELLTFEQDKRGVNTSMQYHFMISGDGNPVVKNERFDWVLGTDGARGVVRKQLGVTFAGETSNVDTIVVGDVIVEGLDPDFWHMWGEASSMLVSLRPTEDPAKFNFILAGKDISNASIADDHAALRRLFISGTGLSESQAKFKAIPWTSNYRPNIRMVDSFGHGRVYLAGDSAHVHSFTGGQGMNTGIQDSFNLSWKVALIQRGFAPHSLLKSYDDERLPVVGEMLERTTALLNHTFTKNARPSVFGRGSGLLQLGVHYRWSSIVVDEQADFDDDVDLVDPTASEHSESYNTGDQIRAGDRAPDAPALVDVQLREDEEPRTIRLFELFDITHHTVLIFTEDSRRCAAIAKEVGTWTPGAIQTVQILRAGTHHATAPFYTDNVVEDTMGHTYEAYTLSDGCFTVVVRPDGFVGAVVQDGMGLRDYFRGILRGELRSTY